MATGAIMGQVNDFKEKAQAEVTKLALEIAKPILGKLADGFERAFSLDDV